MNASEQQINQPSLEQSSDSEQDQQRLLDLQQEEQEEVKPLEKGAAIKKMQELAQGIYNSTPRIADRKSFNLSQRCVEFPKNQSKILSNIKREGGTDDEKGTIRASLFISPETVKLAKHGRIQNKDLAIEVCAQDWQHKYDTILTKFDKERRDAHELRDHLLKKQEMYIYREQEYRDTIQLLKQQIEDNSKKTFLLPKETTDETLELEGGVKLELQRPPAEDANDQIKLQNDKVYRDLKVVKEIKT